MRLPLLSLIATGCFDLPASWADDGGNDSGFVTSSTSSWDDGLAAAEEEVLALVNEQRARGGRCGGRTLPESGPLEMDGQLRGLAREFSRWMAEDQFFDHVDPTGDDPFDRMEEAGFHGALPWGENIAAGYVDAQEVFDGWMSSPGHCENMLDPDYRVIGVGYWTRRDDPSGMIHYWTQEFAGSH